MFSYGRDEALQFLEERIGVDEVRRNWPRIDRLITLWKEYRTLAEWLESNRGISGSKEYKENVTALNGLMQNIRNLENDLDVYREDPAEETLDTSFTEAFDF